MSKITDLTEGNIFKQILIFSLPLIATNLLQVMFNMADVAVVGQFAGPLALGAVGSTTMINSLFVGMLIGFGGGINVVIAFHYGTKNNKNIVEAVHSAFLVSLIIGAIFFVCGELSLKPLLLMLQTKQELIADATLYLRILFLGLPALAVYNCGNAIYSASGNTRKPLIFLAISGIINVILNLFFVIVLQIDVVGVAIASVVSQYISAILILISLFITKAQHRLVFAQMHLTPSKVKSLLKIAFPYAIQNGIFHIANLFFQFGVNNFDTVLVSGNAAALNGDTITYNVMCAFYTACGSFIGQNYGARKKARIKQSYLFCLLMSIIAGIIIFGTICIFGRQFLAIFTKDEKIITAGLYRLYFLGIPYCVTAILDCTTAASRALGHGFIPTIIIIFGSCVFRIIWIYTIFAQLRTIESLYILYPISWIITSIAEVVFFLRVYKKTVSVI